MSAGKTITRRRFLSMSAMAAGLSVMPWAGALASMPMHHWRGILMGAEVSMSIAHPSKETAQQVIKKSVAEIKRLENIFTLYDSYSEVSRLNKHGYLKTPSPEMVEILDLARRYHDITDGAFDVTVYPLEKGKEDFSLIGMNKVHIMEDEIAFDQKGMGVTLNGIAQGYITDKITALLKSEGLSNVLVELGEKRSLGMHPSGRPWLLNVPQQDKPVSLVHQALATSAKHSPNDGIIHIYDPQNRKVIHNSVSVIARTAALADALSTGCMVLEKKKIYHIKATQKEVVDILVA